MFLLQINAGFISMLFISKQTYFSLTNLFKLKIPATEAAGLVLTKGLGENLLPTTV